MRQTVACESMELTPPAGLKNYAVEIIASLNTQELGMLRKTFAENKHPRFMKEFSFHDPYGKSKFFRNSVETADVEKLAKLIGICGMLLQTKVYLFWQSSAQNDR
jgi:hypothetical protein